MNPFLLAEANRQAINAHNPALIKVATLAIGLDTEGTPSYDFNNAEEDARLKAIVLSEDIDQQTTHTITETIYGIADDHLVRRVKSRLKFTNRFQKQLPNGTAVVARQDGSLRVTRNADDYEELVDANAAAEVARVNKYVRGATVRLDKMLVGAVDKVPELAEHIAETRSEVHASLGSAFSRQLALLSGE